MVHGDPLAPVVDAEDFVSPSAPPQLRTAQRLIIITSWASKETEFINDQVPLNKIELTIARWNGLEKTNKTTVVPAQKSLIFGY